MKRFPPLPPARTDGIEPDGLKRAELKDRPDPGYVSAITEEIVGGGLKRGETLVAWIGRRGRGCREGKQTETIG